MKYRPGRTSRFHRATIYVEFTDDVTSAVVDEWLVDVLTRDSTHIIGARTVDIEVSDLMGGKYRGGFEGGEVMGRLGE